MTDKLPVITFADVVGGLSNLQEKGDRWLVKCVFHDDNKPSLNIYKPGTKDSATGFYKCFACGAKGDLVRWFINHEGLTMPQAMAKVYGGKGDKGRKAPPPAPAQEKLSPAQKRLKHNPPKRTRAQHEYRNWDGVITHIVFRMPKNTRGPKTLSYQITPDGGQVMVKNSEGWGTWGEKGQWPVYGLYDLRQKIDKSKSIVIVGGEGDADCVSKLLPGPVLSYPAGDNNVLTADWSKVVEAGKPVILVPDNDAPGRYAMLTLASHLAGAGVDKEKIYVVRIPDHLPKGWDMSDSNFNVQEMRDFLNKHSEKFNEEEELPILTAPKPEPKTAPPEPPPSKPLPQAKTAAATSLPGESLRERVDGDQNPFFRIIGLERVQEKGMRIWVYMKTEHTYQVLSSDAITWGKILDMAPLEWWASMLGVESTIPRTDQSQTIPNVIRDIARRKAPLEPEKMMGRGLNREGDRMMYNLGDRVRDIETGEEFSLISDGFSVPYMASKNPLRWPKSIGQESSAALYEAMLGCSWASPTDGVMFMGFLMVALAGGCLRWRPHIWFVSDTDTGKSFVISLIVRDILGDYSMACAGRITAAGVQRTISSDALGLFIDEAEVRGGLKNRQRMEDIMELMRQSSQWSPKSVHAGTGASDVIGYQPRAPFLLSSNTMGNTSRSDNNRVEVISMEGNLSRQEWEPVEAAIMSACKNGEAVRGWLLDNIPMFYALVPEADLQLGAMGVEKRDARRLAPLLAGAWICRAIDVENTETFGEWVRVQISQRTGTYSAIFDSDAETVLGHLLSQVCMSIDNVRTTAGTLIEQNMGNVKPISHTVDQLAHCGMQIDQQSTQPYLVVGGSCPAIGKALRNTSYEGVNVNQILKQHPMATLGGQRRFAGVRSMSVEFPLLALFTNETVKTNMQRGKEALKKTEDNLPF